MDFNLRKGLHGCGSLVRAGLLLVAGAIAVTLPTPGLAQSSALEIQDTLIPGDALYPGQSLSSRNGHSVLILQADGNLVLYHLPEWKATWASGTAGKRVNMATLQPDGNLVIYGTTWNVLWDSGSHHNYGAYLKLQDDGNMVIYRFGTEPAAGNMVWQTSTWGNP